MRRLINSTYLSLDGDVQHLERWSFDHRSDDVTRITLLMVRAGKGGGGLR
jgi:hypothetical protein